MRERKLFSIGKIIQIRTDPLTVKKLAFVETEEHIRHVVEMMNWLYPNANDRLRHATALHDIGKKIYLQRDFAQKGGKWDSRLSKEKLLADFYGRDGVTDTFKPKEAMERYFAFLKHDGHVKCFVVRQNPEDFNSQIVAARYQLDPPFGNHAASLEPDDLQGVPKADLDYVYSLIQLHHNFQVDKLVAVASRHGEGIIADLYRLMTADQEGSRWPEYVIQKLEGGEEEPQSKFGFSEFAVEMLGEPTVISRDGAHVQGQVALESKLGQWTLTVDYYVGDYDLNPDEFLVAKQKGGKKK